LGVYAVIFLLKLRLISHRDMVHPRVCNLLFLHPGDFVYKLKKLTNKAGFM